MPFDFKAYDAKCQGLTPEELQREWEHYTRLISGAATSTAVSGIAVPFTLGVSTIGVAMAAPAIHNARKKREIIEKHLNRHNATHVTRKRDVLGSMAVSGTIGVVTLGVGSMGADAIATTGAEHGIQTIVENELAVKVVTHAALDGAGLAVEHAHTGHLKKKDAHKAFQKAGVFQAVQDAKAAEAGYSIAPYNPQAAAAGSSSAQPLPPPPPPYSMTTAYQMPPNQAGYQPDFKAPISQTPSAPGQPCMPPGGYAPQAIPQSYGQPPDQTQYYLQPNMTGVSSATVPPYQAPPYSVPGTVGTQSAVPYQPQQQYSQPPPGSTLPSYSAPAASVPGAYDMKALNEALPASVPYTYPVNPAQPSALASSTPQPPPAQHYAAPPIQDPVHASAGTFQQQTAAHGFPPDYKPHPTPAPHQSTPTQPAANQAYPPPPPPPQDYSKRDSIASTLQAPFSPHQNIAAPQPTYPYTPAAVQQPQVAPTPAPPTPYSMPPHAQAPSPPQNTQQYQYSAGVYSPLPSPPQVQQQQQQQYEPLACHQNAPQTYPPPPHAQPAPNYPPTPISLPNSPPVAQQHSAMGYFPPPPGTAPPQTACAPQPHQWTGQPQNNMAYTPAATPGAPWQSYGGAPAYPQYQQ